MIYKNRTQAKALTGLSYIGTVSSSIKHEKAEEFKELTYSIYLAPAKSSGYEVCPVRTEECTLLCLNASGHNRIDKGRIDKARIAKTKLFFEHRTFFVNWVIDEIKTAKARAEKLGYKFSIRLNNTSDISPESFYIKVENRYMNLLEIFHDVQFYDYTKVPKRVKLMEKYSNYDITFSFSGENLEDCKQMLKNNVRVAMVFKDTPDTYLNREVINGDKYDMRYYDKTNVIVGLKYKKVRNTLKTTHKFIIQ